MEISPEMKNSLLRGFSKRYQLDGDILRCRECGQGLIASRDNEDLMHLEECSIGKEFQPNPWVLLADILNTKTSKQHEA